MLCSAQLDGARTISHAAFICTRLGTSKLAAYIWGDTCLSCPAYAVVPKGTAGHNFWHSLRLHHTPASLTLPVHLLLCPLRHTPILDHHHRQPHEPVPDRAHHVRVPYGNIAPEWPRSREASSVQVRSGVMRAGVIASKHADTHRMPEESHPPMDVRSQQVAQSLSRSAERCAYRESVCLTLQPMLTHFDLLNFIIQ